MILYCRNSPQHRPTDRQQWLPLLLLLSCAAWEIRALAQNEADDPVSVEPWYQIEIIVFRNLYPDTGTENFAEQAATIYPDELRQLIPSLGELQAAREAELALSTAPPPLLAAPEEPEPETALLPLAWQRLDAEQRQHDGTVRSLRISRGYRVLAHHAWRQPMPERPMITNLLVTGGAQFDDHFELEGYISLSRSRYLHLETRLSLNEFAPAFDWAGDAISLSKLPPPPLLETVIADETEPTADDTESTDLIEDTPTVVTFGADGVPSIGELVAVDEGNADLVPAEPALPQFVATASWTMLQRRRLRSGELHFLDHPMFGVLLYAEPWSPEPEEG